MKDHHSLEKKDAPVFCIETLRGKKDEGTSWVLWGIATIKDSLDEQTYLQH